jgi:hypothetical protein
MLLKNVPVRLTASLHDTSSAMIEKFYARYINEFGSDHARPALLQHDEPAPPTADNVFALAR